MGGFINAPTSLTLYNSAQNPLGVTYTINVTDDVTTETLSYSSDSLDWDESAGFVFDMDNKLTLNENLSEYKMYTISIKRVFDTVSSNADEIKFKPCHINSIANVITWYSNSTSEVLFADWISDTLVQEGNATGVICDIVGLHANNNKLNKNSGVNSYNLDNTTFHVGNELELRLSIKASLQYTENDGVFVRGGECDFLGDDIKKYYVSGIPSLTGIVGNYNLTDYGKIFMNLDAMGQGENGFDSIIFLITQDGTPNNISGKEYLMRFLDVKADVAKTSGVALVGDSGFTSASDWKFTFNTSSELYGGLSYLTPPSSSSLSDGLTNVMAIATSSRGTDVQVGEVQFANTW